MPYLEVVPELQDDLLVAGCGARLDHLVERLLRLDLQPARVGRVPGFRV